MKLISYDLITYRLEITVDDILFVEQTQAFNNRIAEASNKTHAKTIVVILLNQLVEIETANR